MRLFPTIICTALFAVSTSMPARSAEPVEMIIEGIEGPPLENVRLALALPPGLVHEGRANRLWLERFSRQAPERAATALQPFGYYHAVVTVDLQSLAEDRFRLRVRVEPGPPVRVNSVKLELKGPGSAEERLRQMIDSFPLARGDVLLQQEYERAKENLRARAEELGYLDAGFEKHEIRIAPGETAASILLVMDTGQRFRFGETVIRGAPDYPDAYLRRYLSFSIEDVFSHAALGETQRNFTDSERFREVVVVPRKEQAADFRVPVDILLKQAPRRTLRPGIGYGTDTGGRLSLRYRDLNLFRRGHELNAQLYIAERLQGFAAGYLIPSYRDIRSSTTFQLNLQQEDVTSYVSRLAALEIARNRSFGKGELGTVYLKIQQEEFSVGPQDSATRLVMPGIRFTRDRYDNLIRPVSGYRLALDLRGTHQFLGSDTSLLQLIAEGSHLQPLPWRLGLHTRLRTGFTPLYDALRDIPPSLRFFAGGDQSVRGYGYKSLGPRDQGGDVVGGRQMLAGSVELERALFDNWGVSLFYDAGNAFNEITDITLYQGVGLGLHYYSPVGALNLSLARQLGVSDPEFRIHFSVGFEL